MASYYYLVSSLPEISSDGEAPVTYDEFLLMCESNISEKKYEYLKNLTLDSEDGPIMKDWGEFYRNLTSELNAQRSAILGKAYTKDYDKDSVNAQIAQSAINAKNPLEAEKMLLAYQFDAIDTLIGLHSFDDVYLFGYAIKLKLLERQSCFVKSKGTEEFHRLFETVQQGVYSL